MALNNTNPIIQIEVCYSFNLIYNNVVIIDCNDILIKDKHNYENIMVAIIISKIFGVTNADIKDFLGKFCGIEHRIEFVRKLNGRKFYNDSKSTNVSFKFRILFLF